MIIRQYFSRTRGIPLFSAKCREIVLKAKKKEVKRFAKKTASQKIKKEKRV